MQTYFISGNGFVVEQFICQLLATTRHQVCYLELHGRTQQDLITRLTAIQSTIDESRLSLVAGDADKALFGINPECLKSFNINRFWHFVMPVDWMENLDEALIAQQNWQLKQRLALCLALPEVTFNYVGTAYANGAANGLIEELPFDSVYPAINNVEVMARSGEKQLLDAHQNCGLNYRILRPSMILHAGLVDGAQTADCPTFLHGLIKATNHIKQQVQSKVPDYFSRFKLKLALPPNATLNIITLDQVVEQLLAIAGTDNPNNIHHITHTQEVKVSDLIAALADVCSVPIEIVQDNRAFMPQDQLLEHISQFFYRYFCAKQLFCATNSVSKLSQADNSPVSIELLTKQMQLIHQQVAPQSRVEAPADSLATKGAMPIINKQLATQNGQLDYWCCGDGPKSIFIVNAFGLNSTFWTPLVNLLSPDYKVILWQHRDRQSDQQLNNVYYDEDRYVDVFVEDAKALLTEERTDSCHLLGWCSGPKLALELADKLPELVDSVMMLTPSFPGVSGFDNQDSDFEKSLLTMCKLVNMMPRAAKSMVPSMAAMRAKQEGNLDRFDKAISKEKTESIFSLANESFSKLLYEPFTNETLLVNYSRQLMNFRQHDIAELVNTIEQPVLLLTGSADTTTSSDRAIALCKSLKNITGFEIQGGNHYLHTEQPALTAQIVAGFIERGAKVEINSQLVGGIY